MRLYRSFVHNHIAHPLLWWAEALTFLAEVVHEVTAPEGE